MNKKNIFSYLTIAIFAISCNHVYKEYDKKSFPTYVWKWGQEIHFNPTVQDISKTYKLTLGIRHVYGFQLSSIKVGVKSTSPSGKEVEKKYDLIIRDPAGNYLARCGGDLCDLEIVLEDNLKFEEPGQYKYSIVHKVQVDQIAGVMEIGLILDAVD